MNPPYALLAVMLLGTTASFVDATHMVRVDVGLLVCVTAAVWSFA